MATITGGKVKLDNGQLVTPQTGGWYDGQQYWNGSLSAPGQINSQSDQVGAGQQVSEEVNRQTSVAAGLKPTANQDYINAQLKKGVKASTGTVSNVNAGASTGASSGLSGGGTTSLGTGSSGASGINLMDEQKKLYEASGITGLDTKVTDLQAAIDLKKSEADKRRAEVNENPFLSEASRVGRIAKIDKALNDTLVTDEAKLAGYRTDIASKRADINEKLGIQVQQYNLDRAAKQDNFTMFNSLLASGALANATDQDLANLSAQAGVPISFIQSAIQTSQKKDIQIETQTDNYGNVTILTIDKATGQIVSQVSAGKIGKGESGKTTATELTAAYKDDAINTARGNATLSQMFSIYTGVLDPNDIVYIYNSNSPYGSAKESAAELAKYGVTPINTSQIASQNITYTQPK